MQFSSIPMEDIFCGPSRVLNKLIIFGTCLHEGRTVLESSLPDSMMRRHRGMISVVRRKLITSCSSVLTKAPALKEKDNHEDTVWCEEIKTPKTEVEFTYNSEAGEAQVLKRPRFAHSV